MLIRHALDNRVAIFTITSRKIFEVIVSMKNNILTALGLLSIIYALLTFGSGCAQISSPTGGPTDSLAPVLVKASPAQRSTNFTGNKISLSFNEYIDLQELSSNLLISPVQKQSPVISYSLKSINIRFRDTLLPNTTYSINFGNSIKDVHEGNILRNFTYVFATGNTIDSLTLSGTINLAETGQVDSTIVAMLYRNTSDTAVLKTKPNYIARINGAGEFKFENLPNADFKVYALKDGDGGKTYNAKTELFAFTDTVVNPSTSNNAIRLFAYSEVRPNNNNKIVSVLKAAPEKRLRYITDVQNNTQDILLPLELNFNNPLKKFDSLRPALTDSNFNRLPFTIRLDSTRKKAIVQTNWIAGGVYNLILPKETAEDSIGNSLFRTDTIRFNAKNITEYGRILIRFSNLDLAANPVLQFVAADSVKYSFPITGPEWSNKMFIPGEYEIRILYDDNRNGKWDPGDYSKKRQPEKVITLKERIGIKADWDNERDIKL